MWYGHIASDGYDGLENGSIEFYEGEDGDFDIYSSWRDGGGGYGQGADVDGLDQHHHHQTNYCYHQHHHNHYYY